MAADLPVPTEADYLDAARAMVGDLNYFVSDAPSWVSEMARKPSHRASVDSAYAAGWRARSVTVDRVRANLDEARRVVAEFRSGHNPDCECDWDRGAMSVVESVAVALDEVPVEKP